MNAALVGLRKDRSAGVASGLCSICSSHPDVLETAVRLAAQTRTPLLIEATANQVNQHGGCTGLTAQAFSAQLTGLCEKNDTDPSLIVLGGDHLGPYPWRDQEASVAMREAEELVRSFIRAGAQKVHLDASMPLAGDGVTVLPAEMAARRAVALCVAAEDEWRKINGNGARSAPAYVIGTEVPTPGGTASLADTAHAPVPTREADVHETLDLHHGLFRGAGLRSAWERVAALVVQPGVEFDSRTVHPYSRGDAANLSSAIGSHPGLCFECHSTDYQATAALRAMVEDGFAILKVGPELTFTLREALFGLAAIEEEMLPPEELSPLRAAVLTEMTWDPRHWKGYYAEDESLRFWMIYGYSDRIRYYWNRPAVAKAVHMLFQNLGRVRIPAQLISQFLPNLGPLSDLPPGARDPRELLRMCIGTSIKRYLGACARVERTREVHG